MLILIPNLHELIVIVFVSQNGMSNGKKYRDQPKGRTSTYYTVYSGKPKGMPRAKGEHGVKLLGHLFSDTSQLKLCLGE